MEIAFNCPGCGAELAAEEEWVGESVECPNCSAVVEVPAMATEAEGEENAEAEAEVEEAEPKKRKFNLKPNLDATAEPQPPEGVTPPAPPPPEPEAPSAVVEDNDEDVPVAAQVPTDAEEAEAEEPEKPKGPAFYAIRVALTILVIFIGYKYGVGPVLFHALSKSVSVIVMSKGEDAYKLSLGWRRLRQTLDAGGVARFPPVDVGMPETEGLKITNEATGEKRKLKLKMRPGRIVVVNLDKAYDFYSYNEDQTATTISEADTLIQQIAKQQDPVAADGLRGRLQEIGKGAIHEHHETEIIYGDGMQVRSFGVQTQIARPEDVKGLPVLTHTAAQIKLGNGDLHYHAANPEVFDASLRTKLAEMPMTLGPMELKLGPNPAATVRYDAQRTTVQMSTGEHDVEHPTCTFRGRWQYSATKTDGKWDWRWSFQGNGTDKDGKQWRLDAWYAKGGKKDSKITEVKTWRPPENDK